MCRAAPFFFVHFHCVHLALIRTATRPSRSQLASVADLPPYVHFFVCSTKSRTTACVPAYAGGEPEPGCEQDGGARGASPRS
ncbi:hypothetical protein [Streptomyces sulphureus]|uniref:hypothetical protein n=1 Tax=Streptomyces sulphureus TaxID=47758 RepID=UPI00036EF78E|nr:hypothetical protein [Streptomyces sulphureus]